jgi:hypothetical protein
MSSTKFNINYYSSFGNESYRLTVKQIDRRIIEHVHSLHWEFRLFYTDMQGTQVQDLISVVTLDK